LSRIKDINEVSMEMQKIMGYIIKDITMWSYSKNI